MDLMTQLREKRTQARTAVDQILTRAAADERHLTADEPADHGRLLAEERCGAHNLGWLRCLGVFVGQSAEDRSPLHLGGGPVGDL